jgi:hypothetical protein
MKIYQKKLILIFACCIVSHVCSNPLKCIMGFALSFGCATFSGCESSFAPGLDKTWAVE